jgi:DNA topoisomerase-3
MAPIMTLFIPSSPLIKVLGSSAPLSKKEAIKRVLEYVQANHLQDPAAPTTIVNDDRLLKLFEEPRTETSQVKVHLNKHLTKV